MKESPLTNDQKVVEVLLRPSSWDEYMGQEKVKQNLEVILGAAKKRKEPCDHLLFYGQTGLGKTTLAYLVARELGYSMKVTSGPALEKVGDVAAVLSGLEENEILFIDEIHRLNRMIEEVLYPALETRKLNLMVGKGPGARMFTLDLPPFTLIAATTRVHLLSSPLRSRFGAILKFDYYTQDDIEAILKRSAKILGVKITPSALKKLASVSRSTPRVANQLLKRARDFVEFHTLKEIDDEAIKKTLHLLEIDGLGLTSADRRLLETVITKFHGGPVGVDALSAALNEERGTIEDVYEPYLMSVNLLSRTPGGRVATPRAYEHMGHKKRGEGNLV